MKWCKDCKHFLPSHSYVVKEGGRNSGFTMDNVCGVLSANPVTGEIDTVPRSARIEREDGACGLNAVFFERRRRKSHSSEECSERPDGNEIVDMGGRVADPHFLSREKSMLRKR